MRRGAATDAPVNDVQSTLFWLGLVQLVLAIALMALAGQGMSCCTAVRAGPEVELLLRDLEDDRRSPLRQAVPAGSRRRFVARPARAARRGVAAARRLRLDVFAIAQRVHGAGCRRPMPAARLTDARAARALVLQSVGRLVRAVPAARDGARALRDDARRSSPRIRSRSRASASRSRSGPQARGARVVRPRDRGLHPTTPRRTSTAGSCCRS